MIYVKNHIPCIYKQTFLIGTFYRPPNSEASKWEYWAFSLEKAEDSNINIIITGDFNCNSYNTHDSKILDIVRGQGMSQLISECTHFTENSATLLDLLVVNHIDVIEFSGVGDNVLPNNIRYHCPIFVY